MSDVLASAGSASTNALPAGRPAPAPSAGAGPGTGHSLFDTVLSDLNPLQYIPVIGTLYRAITGDQGDPALRFVASLGTGFALGGPVGVAIAVGEKITGIDPERAVLDVARHLFHLGHAAESPPATAAPPDAPAVPQTDPQSPVTSALAFAFDTSRMNADDLNGLELARLRA